MNRNGLPQAVIVGPQAPYPPTSGATKRTLRTLEAIDRAGAEVHYFTSASLDGLAHREMADRGWFIHSIPDDFDSIRTRLDVHLRLRPGRRSARLASAVRRFCTRRTAFVQAEQIYSEGYLFRALEIPTILSTHNVDSQAEQMHARELPRVTVARLRSSYRAFRYSRAERRSRHADTVLCVSDDDASYYRQHTPNVIVAPNGVDDEFFEACDDHGANEDILFFGLMLYEPNAEGIARFLQQSWPVLRESRPNARLLIAGQGAAQRLNGSELDSRVSVLGYVDDIAKLVRRARVVIVPIWRGGGTRLKVLEAMATGRPVVGTSLGVSGIQFQHGVHGIVSDEPADFAHAVAGLCADPVRADALGAEARTLARRFRWRTALEPAENQYRVYIDEAAKRMRRSAAP